MGGRCISALGLSSSCQNGSLDDFSRNQPQSDPEAGFGSGCGFRQGLNRDNKYIINESTPPHDLPPQVGRLRGREEVEVDIYFYELHMRHTFGRGSSFQSY